MANVAKILSTYPCGTKLWCPNAGYLTLSCCSDVQIMCYPAGISDDEAVDSNLYLYNADGTHPDLPGSELFLVDEHGYKSQPWAEIENKIRNKHVYVKGDPNNVIGVKQTLISLGARNLEMIDSRIDNKSAWANPYSRFFILTDIIDSRECNVLLFHDNENLNIAPENFINNILLTHCIEIKASKVKPDLAVGKIVYVTDNIETGVKVAKYCGKGEANLICAPLPKCVFKYIFDPDELAYKSFEECFNYSVYNV